jgi:hypothetical protein
LFGFRCWRSSGYRAKCGSRKNVVTTQKFVIHFLIIKVPNFGPR